MFNVRFDFDFEEFKRNASLYRQRGTKPLHFTETGRGAITEACRVLGRLSQLATVPAPLRNRLLIKYFGAHDHPQLVRNLNLLNNKIQSRHHTVTFVDGTNRHVAVKVDPQNIDNPQRLMDTPFTDAQMAGAGAWVHTLPGTGAPRNPGEHHVGSGFRIILGRAWKMNTTKYERAGVIYHELTHKILGTNDHVYGPDACKQLIFVRAVKNADNYNYFIEELGELRDRGITA